MKTPEFVWFDLGKVLVDFSHERMCEQMANAVGVSAELVRKVVFDDGLGNLYESGQMTTRQFFDRFLDAVGASCALDELLLAAADIFTLRSEMVPLVEWLSGQDVRLGILSNTCEAHWGFVSDGRFDQLLKHFTVHALSFEIGAMKPAHEIYAAAVELSGVAPEQCFFTDDRPENIKGAIAAGFDAHLFKSAPETERLLRERLNQCGTE